VLRQLNLKTLKAEQKQFHVMLPREVAYYILNKKREDLLDIEHKREVSISVEIDPELVPGQSRITSSVQ
jgi:ribonuclease E